MKSRHFKFSNPVGSLLNEKICYTPILTLCVLYKLWVVSSARPEASVSENQVFISASNSTTWRLNSNDWEIKGRQITWLHWINVTYNGSTYFLWKLIWPTTRKLELGGEVTPLQQLVDLRELPLLKNSISYGRSCANSWRGIGNTQLNISQKRPKYMVSTWVDDYTPSWPQHSSS